MPSSPRKTEQENIQLYVITSVLIFKTEYLHTFLIFIASVSKAVIFPVREISVKKPLQFSNFTTLTEFELERHVRGHNLDVLISGPAIQVIQTN